MKNRLQNNSEHFAQTSTFSPGFIVLHANVWKKKTKYMRYINVHHVEHKYISYIIYKVRQDNSVILVSKVPSKLKDP